ncbi:hypothetical protein NMD15_08240 [Plesiomonas shigelloides]|uniref:hypothetical protein n=1 Tax=Plesiomonas shigelloides TaxID=703 RepID=UPI00351D0FED
MAEVERTDEAIRYFERCKASTQTRAKIRGTIYFNIGEQSGNGYQQSCLVLHALGDTHFVENWPVNFHEKLCEEAKLWLLPIESFYFIA